MKWKTIILSDIHLGMTDSKANELNEFLKSNKCDKLILAGDIIDGWALKRGSKWKSKHTKVINRFLKISTKSEVIWLRGNHDEFIKELLPIKLGNISVQEEYILDNEYLVIHGDIFDIFATKFKWLSKIGSIFYDMALTVNRIYNFFRKIRGKSYLSISQKMKESVKFAVNFINNFEKFIVNISKEKNLKGVICGHIHYPIIKDIDGIIYMNSGDWIENMSALCQDFNGNWQIKYFKH